MSAPRFLYCHLVAVAGFLAGGLFGFIVCLYTMPGPGGDVIILGIALLGAFMAATAYLVRSSVQPTKSTQRDDGESSVADETPPVCGKGTATHDRGLLALAAFLSGPILGAIIGILGGIGEHPLDRSLYVGPIMVIGFIVGTVVAAVILALGAIDR